MVDEDPYASLRKLAVGLQVDEATLRRAVHEGLHCKSYAFKVHQMLLQAIKTKRLEHCDLLVSCLKHGLLDACMLSQKRIFYY